MLSNKCYINFRALLLIKQPTCAVSSKGEVDPKNGALVVVSLRADRDRELQITPVPVGLSANITTYSKREAAYSCYSLMELNYMASAASFEASASVSSMTGRACRVCAISKAKCIPRLESANGKCERYVFLACLKSTIHTAIAFEGQEMITNMILLYIC
jgi:hypothetical protein